jgi:hypothetical protein
MNRENIEAQEELAFNTMDDLLDTASWRRGVVVIKTNKTVFFCYDVAQLRSALLELALSVVKNKFKQCDADLGPVVDNALDEYSEELKQYKLFEKPRMRFKKAQ